jgi:DNA repair protein RadC
MLEAKIVGRFDSNNGDKGQSAARSRLMQLGPRALSSGELIALVLSGDSKQPAIITAEELLARHQDLFSLSKLDPVLLCQEPEVGCDRAARMVAAFELGLRCQKNKSKESLTVHGPEDLTQILYAEMHGLEREHFVALYMDTRHRLTGHQMISVGCLNASIVHPREVFRGAIARGSAAIIVAHNHPSGCTLPSVEDLSLTARLSECGKLVGIELLDHLIIGDNEFTSLRQYGWPGDSTDNGYLPEYVEGA